MSDRLMVILSAPTATGKGTVIRELLSRREDLFVSVSVTTRETRKDEIDGVHYHFITDEAFERLVDAGELLEHAGVWGKRYGSPAAPVREALERGCDVIFDIDVQGAYKIREKHPDCVLIFMVAPTVDSMPTAEMPTP